MEEEPIREISENIIKNEQATKTKISQVFSSTSVTRVCIMSSKHLSYIYLGFFVVVSVIVGERFSPDAVF